MTRALTPEQRARHIADARAALAGLTYAVEGVLRRIETADHEGARPVVPPADWSALNVARACLDYPVARLSADVGAAGDQPAENPLIDAEAKSAQETQSRARMSSHDDRNR